MAAIRALVAVLSDDDDFESVLSCIDTQRKNDSSLVLLSTARGEGENRIEGYVEYVVPTYTDMAFSLHFRMQRTTFQQLMERIGPSLKQGPVLLETKVLATIWILANLESFRGVADRFDLSKGNLHFIFIDVCKTLNNELLGEMVRWPNQVERRRIAHAVEEKYGFPGVIGFVDGSHIPIKGQEHCGESYINRKGFSSIVMQGTCNERLVFTDIFIWYAGSVHDARVWRNSPLHTGLESGSISTDDGHLLGDSAYPLQEFLLTPFKDNGHLTYEEKNYNVTHSMARSCIERAFALLKGKFRRLKFLEMSLTAEIPNVIAACAILHNFIISKEEENHQWSNLQSLLRFGASGADKRRTITHYLRS